MPVEADASTENTPSLSFESLDPVGRLLLTAAVALAFAGLLYLGAAMGALRPLSAFSVGGENGVVATDIEPWMAYTLAVLTITISGLIIYGLSKTGNGVALLRLLLRQKHP